MSPEGRPLLLRHVMLAVVLTVSISARAVAQLAPDCATRDCASLSQIWVPAAQIHELKTQFVAAVRQFTEALAGTYGDEGRRILSSIESLDRARVQWEDAITAYEMMLSKVADSAEVHVALGTVYLDRNRSDDALRELAAAGRLDPRRADVHSLSALAYGLGSRPAEAAQALLEASALDGGNPITFYGLAQHLIKSGRHEQASDALRMFEDSQRKKSREPGAKSGPATPFERVSLLRQASGVAPIFPVHFYRRGFELLLAGSYEQAIGEFRRAAADDPLAADSAGAIDAIAEGGAALRRGQLASALRGLEAAVVTAPNRSEAHRILGLAYWADGQHEKSVAQLNTAIRLASRDERSRMTLADVLVDAGRVDEAEHTLQEAVKAIPDSGLAHHRLGQIYQRLSLLPRAVQELERAASLKPLVGLDRLYETIGGLYMNQANFDSAVDAYVNRIDVNPNNAGAHLKLGETYFLQGRDDEALAEYAATLLVDPMNSQALAAAGQVYLRMGRYAEALETSQQALALDARHKEARYALATSLLRLGRIEDGKHELEVFQRLQAEAIAAAQRQSELNVTKADAALRLGKGEYGAAAVLLRKALLSEPNAASVNRDLGFALVKAGRYDEAIEALDKALQVEESAEAHQFLAEAYQALGRLADSQAQAALSARAIERMKEERLRKMSGGR